MRPGTQEKKFLERKSNSYDYVDQDNSPPNFHSNVTLPAEMTSYGNTSQEAQMILADRRLIEDTILVADLIPHIPLLGK